VKNATDENKALLTFFTDASRFGYDSLDFTTLEKQRPDAEFYNKLLEMNKQIGFLSALQIEALCNKVNIPGTNKELQKQKCALDREPLAKKNRTKFASKVVSDSEINKIMINTNLKNANLQQQLGYKPTTRKNSKKPNNKPNVISSQPSFGNANNIEMQTVFRKSGNLKQPAKLPSPRKSITNSRASNTKELRKQQRSSNSRTHLMANESAKINADGIKYNANFMKWFAKQK